MSKDNTNSSVWNVPNKLSAARLVLAFVVFGLIATGHLNPILYWIALVIFVIAVATDALDGWWARKYNQVTQLGRILDPFCDKIIICGTYILLAVAMRDHFPWFATLTGWMAVIVVGRELLVTALRSFIEQSGGDFSAKMAGKLKMVFQCFAVGSCLVALALKTQTLKTGALNTGGDFVLPTWLLWTMSVSIWLSVLSTLQSGYGYVAASWKSIVK